MQHTIQAHVIPGTIKVRIFLTAKLRNESDSLTENTNPESQKNNIIAKAEATALNGSGKTLCKIKTRTIPKPFALSTQVMRLFGIAYRVPSAFSLSQHIINKREDFPVPPVGLHSGFQHNPRTSDEGTTSEKGNRI